MGAYRQTGAESCFLNLFKWFQRRGGRLRFPDLLLPPLSSDWCFAFPCLPAFMASSCVQRCGCSNKEPFNFTYNFYIWKGAWEIVLGMNRNSVWTVRLHTCAQSVCDMNREKETKKGEETKTIPALSVRQTDIKREDIDILLLVVYL